MKPLSRFRGRDTYLASSSITRAHPRDILLYTLTPGVYTLRPIQDALAFAALILISMPAGATASASSQSCCCTMAAVRVAAERHSCRTTWKCCIAATTTARCHHWARAKDVEESSATDRGSGRVR